jgi:hypothetical protein
MGVLGWIVLGLIVGAIATGILPAGWRVDRHFDPRSSWSDRRRLDRQCARHSAETFWSIQTWLVAIAGEVLVLFISGPSPCVGERPRFYPFLLGFHLLQSE